MSVPLVHSIVSLAKQADEESWEAFFDYCYKLGGEGKVHILSVEKPKMDTATGQRVRTIRARICHSEGGQADVLFHIGVQGDELFTGYEAPQLQDHYRVTLPDGRVYGDNLWWDDNKESAVYRAWVAISPIKMAIWWATYARLLDGRPLIDGGQNV